MEIEYTIDSENNLIRLKAWGEVTADEFIRNARALCNDPQFKEGMNLLVDASGAEFKHSFREAVMIHDFVAAFEHARGAGMWAIYDAGKSEARSFFNLYTIVSNDLRIETRAFDNFSKAEQWVLGLIGI